MRTEDQALHFGWVNITSCRVVLVLGSLPQLQECCEPNSNKKKYDTTKTSVLELDDELRTKEERGNLIITGSSSKRT